MGPTKRGNVGTVLSGSFSRVLPSHSFNQSHDDTRYFLDISPKCCFLSRLFSLRFQRSAWRVPTWSVAPRQPTAPLSPGNDNTRTEPTSMLIDIGMSLALVSSATSSTAVAEPLHRKRPCLAVLSTPARRHIRLPTFLAEVLTANHPSRAAALLHRLRQLWQMALQPDRIM
jgi:hypothetical protein